ncbi:sensor histidine kinase [Mucilaginibacter sp. OK283]|uniref:sensor histidine kinase n=1 Tax=Mucilaginibacter sp. OK283 TaxID=1881049 RepID=UPI0008BCD4D1|nr:sensor histidine kinase [Mucilaginibacter sp. OK283]SEP05947.1 Histidine kinase [Mucilaginibacter sp. OK283]
MIVSKKATNIFIHAAGWLVFFGFPLLFMNRTQQSSSSTYNVILSPYYWLFCLTYIFMFYFNAWYLVPRFVFHKKYVVYGLIVLLLSGCVYFLQPFDNLLLHNLVKEKQSTAAPIGPQLIPGADSGTANPKNLPFGPLPHEDLRMQDPSLKKPSNQIILIHQSGNIDMVGLFIFIIVIGLGIAMSTVQKWQLTEQMVIRAEAEKTHAELSFLKAQINPHFLFNTLNNIYALSVTDSEHTSESIMKLSNIMRYVTDEVTEDFVLLQSEIDCINDYIDLQKLRLGKKTKLDFNFNGDMAQKKVPPLVLMTFIENVFKYGVSKHEPSVISINIKVTEDKILFTCENTIFDNRPASSRKGIGITNTRQRLQHIYPGRHRLNISQEAAMFRVELEIDA